MNNKEAIGQIEWVKKRISNITYSPESFEALNLAIKALEERQTPTVEHKCETCKYKRCYITEKPCKECSRAWADLYEEAENDQR